MQNTYNSKNFLKITRLILFNIRYKQYLLMKLNTSWSYVTKEGVFLLLIDITFLLGNSKIWLIVSWLKGDQYT